MTTELQPQLPPPIGDGAYRITLVCLGNICRSPMAHVVVEDLVERAGLTSSVRLSSAGVADYHVGKPMDPRAAEVLTEHGYDASRHRARQFDPAWLDDVDLVLAMDRSNLHSLPPLDHRVRLFRSFDPQATDADCDVPDPYYGGDEGFDEVLEMVDRTGKELVRQLTDVLGHPFQG